MIPNFLRGVRIPSILTPQWFVTFSVEKQRGLFSLYILKVVLFCFFQVQPVLA